MHYEVAESLHTVAAIHLLAEIGKRPSRVQGDRGHVSLADFFRHAIDYKPGHIVLGDLEPLEDADAHSVGRLLHQLALRVQFRVEVFVHDVRVATAQPVLNHHAALFWSDGRAFQPDFHLRVEHNHRLSRVVALQLQQRHLRDD